MADVNFCASRTCPRKDVIIPIREYPLGSVNRGDQFIYVMLAAVILLSRGILQLSR